MATLIVDGNNMCARFAHSYDLLTSTGKLSGVVYGVMLFLRRFLSSHREYDRVIFAFDSSVPKFRYKLCPEYKATRAAQRKKRKESELFYYSYMEQVEILKEVLPKLNVIVAVLPNFEADDAVYKLTREIKCDDGFALYSNDRDFLQMVSKKRRIVVVKPVHHRPIDEFISTKPKYYLMQRALWGDVSDNIKGVSGIGEKRSNEIIKAIGESSLSKFFKNVDKCPKYRDKLIENETVIKNNYRVMSLKYAYDNYSGAAMGLYVKARFSPTGFIEICREYELKSMSLEGEIFERLLRVMEHSIPSDNFKKVKKLEPRRE